MGIKFMSTQLLLK